MSTISLYSIPTDVKNIVRCRFCSRKYKIIRGWGGLIRHIRHRHSDKLLRNHRASTESNAHFPPLAPHVIEEEFEKRDSPTNGGTAVPDNIQRFHSPASENLRLVVSDQPEELQGRKLESEQLLAYISSERGQLNNGINSSSSTISKKNTNSPALLNDQPDLKKIEGTLQHFLMEYGKETESLHIFGGTPQNTEIETKETSPVDAPDSRLMGETLGTSDPTNFPILAVKTSFLNPFGCVVCPSSFPRVQDLTTHAESNHWTSFRCNACFAEFARAAHLEQHYVFAHVVTGFFTSNQ